MRFRNVLDVPDEPAFPVKNDGVYCSGMMLRDYFAGQALIAATVDDNLTCEQIADFCYRMADAMLAARATPQRGKVGDGYSI